MIVGSVTTQKIAVSVSNSAYALAKQLSDLLTTSDVWEKSPSDESAIALMLVTPSDLSDIVELTRSWCDRNSQADLVWVAPACPKDTDLGEKLAEAEAIVTSKEKNTLMVRHAPLIDELLRNNKEIKFRRTLSLPLGDDALPWLSSQDLVDVVYNWLQDENRSDRQITITGTTQLTGNDLASLISEALEDNLDSRKYAMRRFKAIDADKSGEIDAEEMFPYLLELGYGKEEAQTIIDEADTNQDGSIDFEEFIEGLGEHLKKI